MHDNKPGYYDCVLLSRPVRAERPLFDVAQSCTNILLEVCCNYDKGVLQSMTVKEFKDVAAARGLPKQGMSQVLCSNLHCHPAVAAAC